MANSFPPNPWTQQFNMLCLTLEAWYGCVMKKSRIVFVTRNTFKGLGFSEATITGFMDYLRRTGTADPVDKKDKGLRNCLQPTNSRLLDIRNFFNDRIAALEKSETLSSESGVEILRLKKLKQFTEEIYAYLF